MGSLFYGTIKILHEEGKGECRMELWQDEDTGLVYGIDIKHFQVDSEVVFNPYTGEENELPDPNVDRGKVIEHNIVGVLISLKEKVLARNFSLEILRHTADYLCDLIGGKCENEEVEKHLTFNGLVRRL